jgi:dihydrolipoamide dehydrogenase
MEATVEELAEMIHAHPTLSELLMEAAQELRDQAIHVPRRGVS